VLNLMVMTGHRCRIRDSHGRTTRQDTVPGLRLRTGQREETSRFTTCRPVPNPGFPGVLAGPGRDASAKTGTDLNADKPDQGRTPYNPIFESLPAKQTDTCPAGTAGAKAKLTPMTSFNFQTAQETLHGTTCLVTGGAGFIGSHLVDALLACGSRVRVLDNFSTGFEKNLAHVFSHPDFTLLRGDCAETQTVDAAVAGVDYIFHEAAMASVPRSVREPLLCNAWCTTSTVNLLAAAQLHGVKRLVLASTSAAYGNSPFVAKRESDPVDPLSPYAAAKLAAEQYCRAFTTGQGVETVILRYFNVFGPRQDPKSEYSAVIPRFVSMILAGQLPIIYGDGEQSRDFVYVGDVARANLLAAANPSVAGGVFNIGRGSSTTLLQLLDMLTKLLDRPIEPIHEPARIGDVRDSLADITQARQKLGFEPQTPVNDGLRASIEYYRQAIEQPA
jgi:nucleoside-diphosphate-sugar epimerase